MENYRHNIAINLTQLRKKKGLTQSELAKELHYADKAVSKWENEYTIPSLETLIEISKFYSVSIDYLISNHSDDEPIVQQEEKRHRLNSRNKLIISLMSILGVWLAACIIYTVFSITTSDPNIWMSFLWAVPTSCVVGVVFNEIWGRKNVRFIIISLLMWTLISATFVQFILYNINLWMLFVIGVPIQIGFILWAKMELKDKKTTNK